jgi:sec-independent protein translocase protein TatB
MLIIGVVAIIVVGPKDLPQLLRTVGGWFGRMKRMARDFQRQLDQAVRDEELDKLRKEVAELHRSTNADITKSLNPPDRHVPRRTVTVDGKVMPAPEMVQRNATAAVPAAAPVAPVADAPLDVPDTAASVEIPAALEPAGPAGVTR